MIPSKPMVVSAISPDEEAMMDKMTEPAPAEGDMGHIDEFVQSLAKSELEYLISKAQDTLGKLGEEGVETEELEEEDSGATENVEGE